MKMTLSIYVLLFISLTFASCTNNAATQNNNSSNKRKNSEQIKIDEKASKELQKQIEEIASAAKGRVGAAATVLETGETVSFNPNEQFPMQSVYKLPIGMAVMRAVDEGKIRLDQKIRVEKSDFVRQGMHSPVRDKNPNGVELGVRELLRFSVSESDGTASDVLLKLVGTEEVAKYLSELEIKDIIVANSEKEIGRDWDTQYRNWATPEAAVALLRALHERRGGLSEQSQALLLKFMIESPTGQRRLKGFLPPGSIVAHKTGTSGTQKGITAATNDIGIITLPDGRHLAVAVFVSDSPADEKTREEVIAKIAKAVWDKWSN